jgi:hypothetical protein
MIVTFSFLNVEKCALEPYPLLLQDDAYVEDVVNWLIAEGFTFEASTCGVSGVYVFQIVYEHSVFAERMATKGGAVRSVFGMVECVELSDAQKFKEARIAVIASISESDFDN